MTDREFKDSLEQAKLESLAEFAAGAGHEINNPLATILGRTELLLRRVDRLAPSGETAEAARDLNVIAGQVQRIRSMIGDLMLFARPPVPHFEACDLSEAVREIVKNQGGAAAFHGVELRQAPGEVVMVRADRVQLAIVVSELIRNSLQATPAGGLIEISTGAGERAGMARLTIADNGSGLSEADRAHLFDPFYSGRQAGRGLGFGLCKCWRIMQLHGGAIEVLPRGGGGVIAVVAWPGVTPGANAGETVAASDRDADL